MDNSNLEDIKNNPGKDPMDGLKKSIAIYNKELAITSAGELINRKVNPLIIIEAMTGVMKLIGDAYENDELFLPDLIGASDTMSSVMPSVEEEIKKNGQKIKSLGIVVLGTVLGDVHSIGKQMVGTMLQAEGFTVHDIGIDISAEKFINAIKTYDADILAMSALLTTTAFEQEKVISTLVKEGLREKIKIMVGGGAVTEDFARNIGADGYDPTAPGAAKLARKLIEK
ncbi:MAG: cobalamin-dependent protein [Actinobacteria bacterium]|nr:cobalamin-dependent protein [Actinomycetota bacterium]